jgi:hypothetical protein
MINGGTQRGIRSGQVGMLHLCRRGGYMGFVGGCQFRWRWFRSDAAGAVEGRVINSRVVYDGLVVHVGDVDTAKVIDGTVVK